MDKIFEVKSTTGQIMNVYEDIETYTDFFNYTIMWYRDCRQNIFV